MKLRAGRKRMIYQRPATLTTKIQRGLRIDTFVDGPGTGNAAVVFAQTASSPTEWLQQIAKEMDVSETAFLQSVPGGFSLRWFSPLVEVPLCGHGTLAAAHLLYETGYFNRQPTATFFTKSGVLTARSLGDRIELDFPALGQRAVEPTSPLQRGLGVPLKYVGTSGEDYLVELESEEVVRSLHPDMAILASLRARAIMITSRASSSRYDIVSRVFAPRLGIDEDPVTGSAHCWLGPFWMSKLGKQELIAYQASARGGILHVRKRDDRILISGKAVTVCTVMHPRKKIP